jgi:hypothetical protein
VAPVFTRRNFSPTVSVASQLPFEVEPQAGAQREGALRLADLDVIRDEVVRHREHQVLDACGHGDRRARCGRLPRVIHG